MRVLVTGGGGFLGRAIVTALQARGHEVSSGSRGTYPELADCGVATIQLDLADEAATAAAVAEHDAVIHTAALTGIWGPREDFFKTNVDGTRNVISGCLKHGVSRLVYTSSPSVCFDGRGHRAAKNDLPYAKRYLCAYPETKAIAERLVLKANGRSLATCALRPHLIFGPRDPHLIPRLIERARKGRLAIVGDGTNEVSLTFVENAAAAHVDALEALEADAAHAGRAYFLGQKEPVRLWDWIGELFERVGVPPVTRRVPKRVAYVGGAVLELVWNLFSRAGEPPMTRFVASQLAVDHSYDLGPAERDFGYRERVDLALATDRLVASLQGAESTAGSG
jgi:nucleoside-diphosphate-sugar epimerase